MAVYLKMNTPNTCTPYSIRKNRVPLSPLTPEYSPCVKPKPVDFEKENQYFSTPSTYESPHSDMESPYFTLR
ncbi:hypothetical protein SteCoe_16141 [Stentor coeruleus]|uniref:Uncharacterized protein n=1 Tax=Stentor coeruleus TaxID=5963 RepID=A0A1R2C273_9CILI|nr:hypothetical protein SteCoe_16141 [Stentor coeruleus]